MDKNKLTEVLTDWFPNFIGNSYGSEYEVLEVINPAQQLSRLNNDYIKNMPNYSSWEFKPDIVGILRRKSDSTIKLAFINRTTSGISLKEIGELHCYAKLAKVDFAFLASISGVSNEVNILLVDKAIRSRVLGYEDGKSICLFSWSEEFSGVNKNSILPIEMRNYFS
ncbi:hypothetical protein LZG75_12085 [Polynucleobacter sp. IMCC30063]|uniref:hypothetical protein n=1 Tax=Polynucleobacter sp. IMCC30063 TaxID=2907298 RepID=UPI001F48761B|nr:hypothetical protein [Polynucleobacter sp. IMCC30063]MCE7506968.1 hypothetical protein [Polynucleobacter sp. IMCC30063]